MTYYKFVVAEPDGTLTTPITTLRIAPKVEWKPGEWVEIPEQDRSPRICRAGMLHCLPSKTAAFLLIRDMYDCPDLLLYRCEIDAVVDTTWYTDSHYNRKLKYWVPKRVTTKVGAYKMRIVGEPLPLSKRLTALINSRGG
jgi:hypothetical protein